MILLPNFLFIRNDVAWGCASISKFFYEATSRGAMLFIVARTGQSWAACKILRSMRDWAFSMGATSFHFGESSGMNMAPFAKRLGARVERPTYTVEM